eukprot:TRINITY_DN9521_c0_g1_i1.p1 TRINITY_DN9521_c0_g1~~TRINITY_DN9521_c0_g1_i1.p1  ORF type:complete len:2076 (-),score=909.43 TRINITY_DN9521_c0_g1_i1:607-6213(-)
MDADITVKYGSQFLVLAPETYHYGPVLKEVFPPCGRITGGTIVTLKGDNFDEPLAQIGALPLPAEGEVDVRVEVVFNSTRELSPSVVFDGEQLLFVTPTLFSGDTFNKEVLVEVYFRPFDARAFSFNFFYGFTIDSVSSEAGHQGGGDRFSFTGCGLSQFTPAQISVLTNTAAGPSQLCFRGAGPGTGADSLGVVASDTFAEDRVECITNPLPCTDSGSRERELALTLTPGLPPPFELTYNVSALPDYEVGPRVDAISPPNGAWLGGQTVSILGEFFFRTASSPSWRVRVIFEDVLTGTRIRRLGNILSDTLITTVTPTGLPFGSVAQVSVEFFDPVTAAVLCADLPRAASPAYPLLYTFGPVCSSVSPATGKLSGGNLVTIAGSGFLEGRSTAGSSFAAVTSVRLCLERLNERGQCEVFEPVSKRFADFSISNDEIVFRVPGLRQGVRTPVGGNRLFGDVARVFVGFEDVPANALASNLNGSYVECSEYRFTPVVDSISPDRLEAGPPPGSADAFLISGRDFNDAAYNTDVRVDIGVVRQDEVALYPQIDADTTIVGQAASGGQSGRSEAVVVTFDTCNTTVAEGVSLHYGPRIDLVLDPVGNEPSLSEDRNPRQDSWGWHPAGGQDVRVLGAGFEEFDAEPLDLHCLVDGVPVAARLEREVVPETGFDATVLVCVSPPRPFGTEALLEVEFGRVCASGEIDSRQRVVASQRLRYEARIDTVEPSFGVTSGGTPVTVTGEGFVGAWSDYACVFGAFASPPADVSLEGSVLRCETPRERGQFNTDVAVSVLLSPEGGDEGFRALSNHTFHYGPVCLDVQPNNGRIRGGYAVSLVGYGFLDCVDSDYTPITNCEIENFVVHWRDSETGVLLGSSQRLGVQDVLGDFGLEYILNLTMPRASQCQQHAYATIEYLNVDVEEDSQRFVQCSTPPERTDFFHYGPRFERQLSTYHRNGVSYGWDGSAITFLGSNFQDPAVFAGAGSVQCRFGERGLRPAFVVDDTQLTCQAPPGIWNEVVEVDLRWDSPSAELKCVAQREVRGELFHYGPVIDSVRPDRGAVAGLEPITVSGFAFGCCGIEEARCMFPSLDELESVLDADAETVTCPVPPNNNVDRQINNIGVRFLSGVFGVQQGNAYQTTTEDADVLTYFYGPRITSVTPTALRLSGGQRVTVTGEGFKDPYFDGVYCDFLAEDPSHPSDVGTVDLFRSPQFTDTQIVCEVKHFNHPCGAVDHFRPRWHRPCGNKCNHRTELGEWYYRTEGTTDPSNQRLLPYYTDAGGGDPITERLEYGPVILEVTPEEGDGPAGSPQPTLQSWTSGGLRVTVRADDLSDWVTDEEDNAFGSEHALCLFGDRRAAELSPIDRTTHSVTCVAPPGVFGSDVSVGLLLDPHFTDATTIAALEDPAIDDVHAFHWTPFATAISTPWGSTAGHETLTIDGGGFCAYESVVCVFGDDAFENQFSVEGDIVNDNTVQCVTPPHAVGTFDVALDFCITTELSAECRFHGEVDRVRTGLTFTYAGVTGIFPDELSACADLDLLVLGNGFERFDSFQCEVAGQRTLAQRVNDTAVRCFGPQLFVVDHFEPVECNTVALLATDNLRVHRFDAETRVEFGLPQLLRVDPEQADVDRSSEIVIQGRYFQGADEDGSYSCVFGDGIETEADVSFRRIGNDDDDDALREVIRCRSPTLRSHPQLTVGRRTLEVKFDCDKGQESTTSRLPFTFVQSNPVIEGIFPDSGFETGGTSITVFGTNFGGGTGYFCSFGEVDDDDDPRNNPNQLVSAVYVAEGIEESNGDPVLVCRSPANRIDRTTSVDFRVSLDAGKSFVDSEVPFTYTNVPLCNEDGDSDAAAPRGLSSRALLLALLMLSLSLAAALRM